MGSFEAALAVAWGPKPCSTHLGACTKDEATRHEVESKALRPEVWGQAYLKAWKTEDFRPKARC